MGVIAVQVHVFEIRNRLGYGARWLADGSVCMLPTALGFHSTLHFRASVDFWSPRLRTDTQWAGDTDGRIQCLWCGLTLQTGKKTGQVSQSEDVLRQKKGSRASLARYDSCHLLSTEMGMNSSPACSRSKVCMHEPQRAFH